MTETWETSDAVATPARFFGRERPPVWRRFSYLRVHGTFLSRVPVRHASALRPFITITNLLSLRGTNPTPHGNARNTGLESPGYPPTRMSDHEKQAESRSIKVNQGHTFFLMPRTPTHLGPHGPLLTSSWRRPRSRWIVLNPARRSDRRRWGAPLRARRACQPTYTNQLMPMPATGSVVARFAFSSRYTNRRNPFQSNTRQRSRRARRDAPYQTPMNRAKSRLIVVDPMSCSATHGPSDARRSGIQQPSIPRKSNIG